MVSTDGPTVTPDGPDPEDVQSGISNPAAEVFPPDRESGLGEDGQSGSAPAEGETDEGAAESPEDAVPVPATQHKNQAKKRRPRAIDRLLMEFQPDAVEMEHRKVAGGLRWTLYVVILLLIATVAWATWAKVDRLVVAEGKLVTPMTIVVQPPSTSPIRSFDVMFGQTVRSGDVLVTLDPTIPEAEVSKLEAQSNGLQAKMDRLTAEQTDIEFSISGHELDPVWTTEMLVYLDRQKELLALNEQFAAEKRKLEATRKKHEADVQELGGRLVNRQEILETIRGLRETSSATRRELLDEIGQVGFINNQLINARNSIEETNADLDSLAKRQTAEFSSRNAKVSSELADARQTWTAVMEELNKAKRGMELVTMVVPEHPLYDEFVVVEVAELNVGSVVQPGDSLVRLIPADAILEVECKVQSQDIARIRELENGEKRSVRIKLSAFPYMKHGTMEGLVRAISEDVFEEGQPPMTRTFYKIRVEITNYELDNVPGNHRLIPGMAATAEIKVGRRRVIDYFLYPLFRSLDNSIREP